MATSFKPYLKGVFGLIPNPRVRYEVGNGKITTFKGGVEQDSLEIAFNSVVDTPEATPIDVGPIHIVTDGKVKAYGRVMNSMGFIAAIKKEQEIITQPPMVLSEHIVTIPALSPVIKELLQKRTKGLETRQVQSGDLVSKGDRLIVHGNDRGHAFYENRAGGIQSPVAGKVLSINADGEIQVQVSKQFLEENTNSHDFDSADMFLEIYHMIAHRGDLSAAEKREIESLISDEGKKYITSVRGNTTAAQKPVGGEPT